jgi:hypothetical protein
MTDSRIQISSPCELSIVIPCLNEAETLATCIGKALDYMKRSGIVGEVIVADNGSIDGSRDIAGRNGASVITVHKRGYGAAVRGGVGAANGRFVIMGDADDSYDFSSLDAFVKELRDGADLVMGNRFAGGIQRGAMPALHEYFGNPVLSGIGRVFFASPLHDFHCGLRGFKRELIERLDLRTNGMEFASEMIVKATLHKLTIREVPTTLSKDGRSRPPHLRSWHDGWRHLRFLLLYSPRWLFLVPGLLLLATGSVTMAVLLPGPVTIGSTTFDVHTLMLAALAMIVATQTISFAWLAKQFGTNSHLLPATTPFERMRELFTLERALAAGFALIAMGAVGTLLAVYRWGLVGFGDLNYDVMMRLIIPSVTLTVLGMQILLTGFLASILDLDLRES